MSHRQAAFLNVAISILFAAGILLYSAFFNTDGDYTPVGLLIAVWFVPFWILSNWNSKKTIAKEFRCLQKMISKNE